MGQDHPAGHCSTGLSVWALFWHRYTQQRFPVVQERVMLEMCHLPRYKAVKDCRRIDMVAVQTAVYASLPIAPGGARQV